jgi:hypothetical protein
MHLQSLLTYSHANRAVLKLRDQKQLDFEELSDYLSGVTTERDRLSAIISGHAGSSGLGIGAYLKDRVDALRGMDDDRSRVEKMKKLDTKIKEVCLCLLVTMDGFYSPNDLQLQDAVTTAHETSDAFNDATLREQAIFQYAKETEMKDMLGDLADGQIEFYKAVCVPSQYWTYAHPSSGYGRMGESHPYSPTDPCGRLVHLSDCYHTVYYSGAFAFAFFNNSAAFFASSCCSLSFSRSIFNFSADSCTASDTYSFHISTCRSV